MAIFLGTDGADRILRNSLSPGVTSDPAGLTGTAADFGNLIYGYGGADRIESADGGDEVYGGAGNDSLIGAPGADRLYGGAGSDLLDSGSGIFEILDGGAGADRMRGGEGLQFYIVDSYADDVIDTGTSAPDDDSGNDYDIGDYIVTNLNYKLSERSGIESLQLGGDEFLGAPPTSKSVYGTGNSQDNFIFGNKYHNVLDGRAGNDLVQGSGGSDLVLGGNGNDDAQGNDGADIVRGQAGADSVWGGGGKDKLIGGRGDDFFFWNYTSESTAAARDVICAGDGATAFQGAGVSTGDVIGLPNAEGIDADGDIIRLAFDNYTFGGTGKGHISLVNSGADTIVRVNLDDDAAQEYQIQIKDGAVLASSYTVDDFSF